MKGLTALARRRWPLLLLAAGGVLLLGGCATSGTPGAAALPKIDVSVDPTNGTKQNLAGVLQLLILLTLLSVAPAIVLLMTSFTRTVVVLSLVRSAIGLQTLPPNQVVVGLALFLTFFVMAPTWNAAKTAGIDPFLRDELTQEQAAERTMAPFREFMFRQTRVKDLAMFIDFEHKPRPQSKDDITNEEILPAFVISELTTAFKMGFMLYLPFLVIDLVVAAVLMSMGILMLSPAQIALPFKLMFFVLADGWHLVVLALLQTYS